MSRESGTVKKAVSSLCKNCAYRGSPEHHAFCTMTEKYVPRKGSCELFKLKERR